METIAAAVIILVVAVALFAGAVRVGILVGVRLDRVLEARWAGSAEGSAADHEAGRRTPLE
jgi:hypothetical protein